MTSGKLHALQMPNGGFESIVTSRHGRVADCNGFTTAMVLRLTRDVPDDPMMAIVRLRALQFLMTCSSSVVPDAFAFWPDSARPTWASSVPADVDDTAIMLTELVRHGWLDRAAALRRFCHGALPHRVTEADAATLPSWVAPGCFYTWIARANAGTTTACPAVNIVDCCVNANVAALMSRIEARHLPGYDAAILTVLNAVRWAGDDRARLSAVMPFYPSAQSLIDAVEHAAECGVYSFRHALRELNAIGHESSPDAGCCRSAYGSTVWYCQAIDAARELARAAG